MRKRGIQELRDSGVKAARGDRSLGSDPNIPQGFMLGSDPMAKACWVYVLECGDGSYYTGWTNDLARRVAAHQSGKGGKYTRSRLPVRLIKKWRVKDRSLAMRKEARFKSLSRKEKSSLLGIKGFRG